MLNNEEYLIGPFNLKIKGTPCCRQFWYTNEHSYFQIKKNEIETFKPQFHFDVIIKLNDLLARIHGVPRYLSAEELSKFLNLNITEVPKK